jgi:hypothetical protein
MDKNCNKNREVSPAQRGQIIQRVLVEGWSPGQAGAALGIAERQVVHWITAYRRFGMASLRDDAAVEYLPAGSLRRLRTSIARWLAALQRGFGTDLAADCVELRRHRDDRRSQ